MIEAEKIKRRTHCLLCGAKLPEKAVLSFSGLPASAQHILEKEELSRDEGIDLSLYVCETCGLCQFDCEPVSYYKEVIRAVGLSETMKDLRRADYRLLTETYQKNGGSFLECGCGNGDLLKLLSSEFDIKAFGLEYGRENIETAKRLLKDSAVIYEGFPGDQGTPVKASFDCVLSFNFLEHQPDPVSMVRFMYESLKDDGLGLITVPSLEYILNEGKYYEFIRDHIANYDLDSLHTLLSSCGFEILEAGPIGIGDTLRAVVRKLPGRGFEPPKKDKDLTEDTDTGNIKVRFEKIKRDQKRIGYNLKKYTEKLEKEKKTLALWGAGHQGFTIASTTELGDYACCIIDSARFKQGRFAPASHLPIVSPESFILDPTDEIMIVAPGYIREIRESIEKLFKGAGLPTPGITDILSF